MDQIDCAMGWMVLTQPELIDHFDFVGVAYYPDVDIKYFLELAAMWPPRLERAIENSKS
jgi:hypothetical protein